MGARVSIDYVSHTFGRQQQATLKDLELIIESGEALALVGESGCGKSTLLHIMAGLLSPTKGCVRIKGQVVNKPSANWNMMFQKPALYPWLNVRQNAMLGLEFSGKTAGAGKKIDDLLALVGLSDKTNSRIQDLSGGQQQRVALARSLAVEPEIILLDEPFSALDAFTRRMLQNEVLSIVKERGITLVLVTHDIDEAIMMGDRIVVMGRNPGCFRDCLTVPIPYPRNPIHPEFAVIREKLMAAFEASMENKPDMDATANADKSFKQKPKTAQEKHNVRHS